MANFLKIILLIFTLNLLVIGSYKIIDYKRFEAKQGLNIEEIVAKNAYKFQSIPQALNPKIDPPKLPDISIYTAESVKESLPNFQLGSATILPLQEGFRKLRSQVDFFGDMQGRFDPLSLVVIDGVYSLGMLVDEINDPSVLQRKDSKENEFILHVPLSIRAEASVIIQPNETLYLNAEQGALLTSFGSLNIVDANVYAWKVEEDEPAYFEDRDSFRPYITAWCGSELNIIGSTISHIGYQFSKSYGVSYTSCTDTLYREDYAHLPGGTGKIIDSEFYDVYFGFYSYEANDVVILRNEYRNNIVYGVDPHDRSSNLIIAYNHTHGTKEKHGIIVSRDVNNSFIFNNLTENNHGSGIMIDRNSHDNVVAYNIARNNGGDGLTYYESPNNLSYQNKLIGNKSAGLRIRNSWDIISFEDAMNNNKQVGLRLYAVYLSKTNQAKYRDLELDPYTERAGLRMISPEMVGNEGANFKLTKFDHFELFSPQFYKSPVKLFSGDLRPVDKSILSNAMNGKAGVRFTKEDQVTTESN